MPQSLVRIAGLSKIYTEGGRSRTILDRVTLEIAEGEFFVLLGKSGSGKSTLLNLISGIDHPEQGQIFVADTNITALSEHQQTLFRRDYIGIVFQFFNLIPTLTVLENITLPRELAGTNRRTAEAKARALLERVGLANRADTFPDKLSGGEQQRVAIARALVNNPRIIMADEPTGALDSRTGAEIMGIFQQLNREQGITIILVTHDPEVARYAQRSILIRDGMVAGDEINHDQILIKPASHNANTNEEAEVVADEATTAS